jgi:t-SNARE complex subunit (syntaxin)
MTEKIKNNKVYYNWPVSQVNHGRVKMSLTFKRINILHDQLYNYTLQTLQIFLNTKRTISNAKNIKLEQTNKFLKTKRISQQFFKLQKDNTNKQPTVPGESLQ